MNEEVGISSDDTRARLRRGVYFLLIALATGAVMGRIMAVEAVDELAKQEYIIKKRLDTKRDALRESFRERLEKKGLAGEELDEAVDEALKEPLAREEDRLRGLIRAGRPFLSANDRSRWCAVRALVDEDMRVEGFPYAIDKVIDEPTWNTIDKVKHDGHYYSSKPPLFPTLMAGPYWVIHRLTGVTLGTHPYEVGRFMLVVVNVTALVVYFLLLARLVERFGTTDWGRMFVMGAAAFGTFLTTFAVVINNHLPAAASAMVALYTALRIWFDDQRRLRYFVIAGLFAAFTAANELPAVALFAALSCLLLWKAPRQTILAYLPAAIVVAAGFFGTNWIAHRSLRPPYMHRGADNPADNWYDYEGSYFQSRQTRQGIDKGEDAPGEYALHVLVGHHGIFSLTPIWLLSVAGLGVWIFRPPDRRLRQLALLIAAVSLVCLIFYLSRPAEDRNYGGMTSGFRWMFWFAPLWLVCMLPAADALARRTWTRCVGLVLLIVSVGSASYPTWNPWTHPWLMNYLQYIGWV